MSIEGYHLRFWPEEDRLSISVADEGGVERAFMLTRRLVQQLLDALSDLAVRHSPVQTGTNPERANSILRFQHGEAVDAAQRSGAMRQAAPAPETVTPALVKSIAITPQADGGTKLDFVNDPLTLTIVVDPARIHLLLDGLWQMTERAQWNCVRKAAWIAPAGQPAAPEDKSLLN